MDILTILKTILALATVLTGLLALLRPTAVYAFTGLTAPGPRGITEIRAVFGGFFIGLGLAPLFLGLPAYRMLGAAYLAVAAVRLVSIFLDHSSERSNWISLAIEIVFGLLLAI